MKAYAHAVVEMLFRSTISLKSIGQMAENILTLLIGYIFCLLFLNALIIE